MARQLKTWPKALALFLLIGGLYYALRQYEQHMLYAPDVAVSDTPEKIGLPFEAVEFTTADGIVLHGWYVPAESDAASTTNTAPATLLFLRGNAGNMSHSLDRLRVFHDLGLNVLIFDYRGFGQNDGTPSEKGLALDALAAYFYAIHKRHVPPGRLILYGETLGAAVGINLATKVPAAGLITEAAFSSAVEMARRAQPSVPWDLLLYDKYDSWTKIRSVRMPLLLIHSDEDEMIPYRESQRLYANAVAPKELVQLHGSHDDGFVHSFEIYTEKINTFVQRYAVAARP